MVRILSNGEIVADDDPRAQQASRRQNADIYSGQASQRRPQTAGNFQQGNEQQVSIFQALNQRLIGFGIPRFNFGDIVIEPLVSVGLLAALLMFGIHGFMFGLILFAVSRWSTHGAPEIVSRFFGRGNDRNDDSSRGNRDQGRAGGGYRLGR